MNYLAEPAGDAVAEDKAAIDWHSIGDIAKFPINAGIAVKLNERQIAVYRFRAVDLDPGSQLDEWYACDNTCPHKNDNVLARGLIGDHKGELMVACPMHKKAFSLKNGACLNDPDYSVQVYPVRLEGDRVMLGLSPG